MVARAAVLIACVLVLALSGCSSSSAGPWRSSNMSSSGSTESGGDTAAQGPDLTLTVVESPLGTILSDASGHTVYLFTPDKKNKSVCTGPCTDDWPPVAVSGQPTFGDGIDSSLAKVISKPVLFSLSNAWAKFRQVDSLRERESTEMEF